MCTWTLGRHRCPVRGPQPGPATGRHPNQTDQYGPRTADGTSIDLLANINLLGNCPWPREMGAAGIGLYRTEFPFLVRPSFPSETEQYLVYRQVVEHMGDKPVVFRTLDIGGEKTLAYTDTAKEPTQSWVCGPSGLPWPIAIFSCSSCVPSCVPPPTDDHWASCFP
jgi:hypothetical protein